MNRFIALPVGQGDSFFLNRDNYCVLIDGGKSKTAISNWMMEICKTGHLDVLVCTHNDADHANGVIGILEDWAGVINEVWLPGSWTYRMEDLFLNPEAFYIQLFDDIIHFLKTKKQRFSGKLENSSTESEDEDIYNRCRNESDLEDIIENAPVFIPPVYVNCFSCAFFWPLCLPLDKKDRRGATQLLLEYIEAASRIKEIIELAYRRGCKIRFFEFGNEVNGGDSGKLEPLNSKEIIAIGSKRIGALQFLYLTISNAQSLVFFAPEDSKIPAVLFSSDSDFRFSLPKCIPTRPPIVTSPHHGSDENARAYSAVSDWLGENKATWIRSDCKSRTRPGTKYKMQVRKACTLCNCGKYPRQTVKLHSRQGKWQLTRGTRECSCR